MKQRRVIRVYVIRCQMRGWVFYAPPEMLTAYDERPPSGFLDKLLHRVHRIHDAAQTLLHEPPNRFWRGIRRVWQWLERWTHPGEGLLRAIGHADAVELIHDGELADEAIQSQWRQWLAARVGVHERGFWLNIGLLPITLLLGLLPGPNVFIAWNGLRLYVHWQARRGGRRGLLTVKTVARGDARLHPPPYGSEPDCQARITELGHTLHLPELADFYARWPA
ncbi:MAG: hypothetical protein SNJ67_02280 [Chloracidobacterium sp.]|uniref:Uncharacterized protein n=1 Tax=Chloracidobacterium validum TaxID=2821543 RepID=A0ABX8B8R0_9BACT|nr:hypothetical protein [Chloracidobacterium validum]QUW03323.1 hypothetical protein J8C06_02465 [Chloracidobacterium validum]